MICFGLCVIEYIFTQRDRILFTRISQSRPTSDCVEDTFIRQQWTMPLLNCFYCSWANNLKRKKSSKLF